MRRLLLPRLLLLLPLRGGESLQPPRLLRGVLLWGGWLPLLLLLLLWGGWQHLPLLWGNHLPPHLLPLLLCLGWWLLLMMRWTG